jgi:hypothetical protein
MTVITFMANRTRPDPLELTKAWTRTDPTRGSRIQSKVESVCFHCVTILHIGNEIESRQGWNIIASV